MSLDSAALNKEYAHVSIHSFNLELHLLWHGFLIVQIRLGLAEEEFDLFDSNSGSGYLVNLRSDSIIQTGLLCIVDHHCFSALPQLMMLVPALFLYSSILRQFLLLGCLNF